MKEPKLNELQVDEKATRRIRRKMAGENSVKITVHIDGDNLDILRTKSAEAGVPRQRLLNRFLTKALHSDAATESRLDRIEKEITRLKRKVVA